MNRVSSPAAPDGASDGRSVGWQEDIRGVRQERSTIEHDFCRAGEFVRTCMRRILKDPGYTLVCGDVAFPSDSGSMAFEDWWVEATFVRDAKWTPLRCSGRHFTNIIGRIHT